jgi:transposase
VQSVWSPNGPHSPILQLEEIIPRPYGSAAPAARRSGWLTSHYHRRGDPLPMVGRHGERLDAWIDRVEADDQPDLHRFANGVRRDYEAVLNGLALEHSSGAVEGSVEGSVNRIKMIKRQMYGRAGFELLRKRVLLAS